MSQYGPSHEERHPQQSQPYDQQFTANQWMQWQQWQAQHQDDWRHGDQTGSRDGAFVKPEVSETPEEKKDHRQPKPEERHQPDLGSKVDEQKIKQQQDEMWKAHELAHKKACEAFYKTFEDTYRPVTAGH